MQVPGVGARQVPEPSQVPAALSVEPTQLADWQTDPAANRWQAPEPSHRPVVPQVEMSWVAQRLPGLVSMSEGTQVPRMSERVQV
jgi:hypothetical protein